MRFASYVIAVLFLLGSWNGVEAQQPAHHVDIELEPVAYLLGGAGITASYQTGHWRYSLEVFTLTVPEALHANEGFEASPLGVEVHAERFFDETGVGFFIGPEVGVSRLEVTHEASGIAETRVTYSAGVRGGYRWYTGFGNSYLSPQGGLVYSLPVHSDPVEIEGETFETGPFTPFVTVGFGWSF